MNNSSQIFFVGVGGGTASGKTTFVERLRTEAPANKIQIVPLDAYYRLQDGKTLEERALTNYDHPDALEADLLFRHLADLRNGSSFEMPVYDYALHNRTSRTTKVSVAPVVVVEGILTLHYPFLRELFDLKIFVDCSEELRYERRLARDVSERGRTPESVAKQWRDTVKPMHDQYCQTTREVADRIISGIEPEEGMIQEIIQKTL